MNRASRVIADCGQQRRRIFSYGHVRSGLSSFEWVHVSLDNEEMLIFSQVNACLFLPLSYRQPKSNLAERRRPHAHASAGSSLISSANRGSCFSGDSTSSSFLIPSSELPVLIVLFLLESGPGAEKSRDSCSNVSVAESRLFSLTGGFRGLRVPALALECELLVLRSLFVCRASGSGVGVREVDEVRE